MLQTARDHHDRMILLAGQGLPHRDLPDSAKGADWIQARPQLIGGMLERALTLPAGNWFVVDGSSAIAQRPACYWIEGRELVAWRPAHSSTVRVAPNSCPHMGAPLSAGELHDDKLVCPWHGLALGETHGSWHTLETHDDGVLVWVRLGAADPALPRPVLPARPACGIQAVVRQIARCEPREVVANRLDPWHGVHYHPHAFARLKVLDAQPERLALRVAYRLAGPVCVEVDATFHCADARTVVMTIVDGEGTGSVVETHATPMGEGWTSIVEATIATSERLGFRLLHRTASLVRPLLARAANRLWNEDAAYAERTFFLRRGGAAAQPDAPHRWESAPGTPR